MVLGMGLPARLPGGLGQRALLHGVCDASSCSGTKHQLARSGSGSAIPSCVRAPIDVHLPPFRCVPQGKPDLLLPHLQQLSLNDAVDAQA